MENKVYDLTNPQKSIWLTEQFFQGTCVNNICGTVIIDDIVNFEKLKEAINIFVKDNDSFRIKLRYNSSNEIEQYFSDFSEFNINICTLNSDIELLDLENKMVNIPFELIENNLFNFNMFKFENRHGGFVLTAHHLISDACTAGLLASKVINIYSSLLKESTYTEVPTSYINYIETEKNYISSDKFNKDKAYWESSFETVPEFGTIPSLKSFCDDSCNASRKTFIFDTDKVQEINKFCSENKISLFNFFMAIYAIYISRVSNLDDFVLGTPILNRTTFTEKNTPGMFISTVPFKFSIEDSLSFIDFTKKIALDTLSMFRHQKYPYQNILEHIRTKNSAQPNLYDILISYQNTRTNKNISDIPYSVRWTFNNTVADSIQIHLFDMNDEGKLNIAYDYRINKYDDEDICNIHNRISYMIEQVLNSDITLIKDIDIIADDEKELTLNKFNSTYLEYDKTKTIIDYFEDQVEKTPDNIALVFENKTLTYKQLNEYVNSLSHFLRNKGIKNNDIVGVMTTRSFEMLISILAVLKAGGAYIPIDPEYPEERISYMLENSKSTIIISRKSLENKIKGLSFNGTVIFSDLDNDSIYSFNHNNLSKITKPDDLSYLIYTSGSTGNPKGVTLTHKNLSNFIASMFNKVEYLNDNKYHSIISITTVSFDIFAFETLVSLCSGLKLFITNETEQKVTLKLERLLRDNNIEIIQSTPSIMNFHLENSSLNGFENLKYVILAGEQLPKQLVDKIKSISPNCTIYNGYGPSETTIFSSFKDVTDLEIITIGTPINNTQIYILGKDLNLLPIGNIGEIYIAGDGVGKGYLNREDLTSQSFILNPFIPNTIMYKTGDLGLWLKNGEILCKGRADNQIKLRGLRIELGEIEESINSFDKIANIKSAVILKKVADKVTLNAFISSNSQIDIANLKEYLSKILPTYMIPNTFTILEKMPFTPNGKIDRKALNSYKICNNQVSDISYSAPRNEIENIILASIKKKLNIENLGIDNNIFDYGADSLAIINILTDLFHYNFNLKVYDFYKYPTVRQLYDNLLNTSQLNNNLDISKYQMLNNVVKNLSISTTANKSFENKSIFITGVTGFLGAHILANFLDNISNLNKIYCAIRSKDNVTSKQRLLNKMHFYFNDKYDDLINKYVEVIEANINYPMLNLSSDIIDNLKNKIDLVVHTAANVKHYGDYSDFEKTNIDGTKNVIDFCKQLSVPLHYMSTMTISGNYLLKQNVSSSVFSEQAFFENQSFDDNVYSKSKLIAESLVLESISNGLIATIYRIGDLTGRYSDGVFQSNIEDNSIYLRLKSILEIGLVPDNIINNTLEFTPVDYAADAINRIVLSNNSKNRIYHIYNPNMISVKDLVNYIQNLKYKINIVSKDEFINLIKDFSNTDSNQDKIKGIINDFTSDNDLIYNYTIKTDNTITCNYLKSLDFNWPLISFEYIHKMLEYMQNIGFLNNQDRNGD